MIDYLDLLRADLAGGYRIERELGRGGMATVYLARDLKHDRPVALKLLRPELAAGPGPERFLREIRLTAGLQHPHILPLLDSGILDAGTAVPCPYYVMPYVEGESLRQRLDREKQLPLEDALRIARSVASALGYAHARGVVHRDIKPENILLSGDQALVSDFGIARAVSMAGGDRLTETGMAIGTPQYMSPEQAAGDQSVGPRSDVYALGCVLYEMLAGEPPFTGPTAAALLARRMRDPSPRVRAVRETVPEEVERAILRALAPVAADRFATGAEFGAAISEPAFARGDRAGGGSRPGAVAVAFAALLALAVGSALWLRARQPEIVPSASLIAVLPFTPSGPDSALVRLGRDLVFTLSATLDGLGGIQVADAHSVLAAAREENRSVAGRIALARRFGAGGVVHGSLVREGSGVRLDFVLLATDSAGAPVARASVTGSPDSVAALTDSATRALLRQVWARGSPPTPSLDGALKTRSVAALRAFLDGERELAGGRWDDAAASYERAMLADSTFWLAYARHVYSRNWSVEEAEDSVVRPLVAHLSELPERERLTTEAIVLWASDSNGLALERAREVSERYPSSWFGWLLYGDNLLHNGPLLGHPLAESRTALERATLLNRDLIPGWEHLVLLDLLDRDTAATADALGELTRLDAFPAMSADGYGNRRVQFHFLDAVTRGDSGAASVLADSMARDPAPTSPDGSFYDAFRYGFFAEQVRVSLQVLSDPDAQARTAIHHRLLAWSWAGRGAWDSALAAMDRLAASGLDPEAALRSYGMAVAGGWLGALGLEEAAARREAALATAGDSAGRAEVAWLDGVAAAGRGDRQALSQARIALRQAGVSSGSALGRSLAAFESAARGETRDAGEAMARLEWQQAALGAPEFVLHPFAIPLNRIAAARWLVEAGDPAQAERLLTWVDGPYSLHPATPYSVMLTGLVNLQRARIEQSTGRIQRAMRHYGDFVRRYDRPVARHQRLVAEANAALKLISSP